MSDKGKEKAPQDIISFSDDDSDDDFFVSKRAPVFRAVTPLRSPTPPPRDYSSSDESDPDNPKKKRKKPARSKPVSTLPDWARRTSHETKSRARKGSSQLRGSREVSEVLVISDSENATIEGGSASIQPRRRRIMLTPPPELSEQKKAEVHRLVEQHLGEAEVIENTSESPSQMTPIKEGEDGETCAITIRMEAPPERRAHATPAAINQYQKPRTLTVFKNGSLSRGIAILAERLQKRAEDIVLVYDGNKVYPRSTPAGLGIIDRAEMTGYEKDYWQKLEADRRAKLVESDDDDEIEPLNPPVQPSASSSPITGLTSNVNPKPANGRASPSQTKSQTLSQPRSQTQTIPTEKETVRGGSASVPVSGEGGIGMQDFTDMTANTDTKVDTASQVSIIRFKLRSSTGQEQNFKAPLSMKAITVLRFFSVKMGGKKEDADWLKLVWDGESVDRETTIGELDVEDGDVMDVISIPKPPTDGRRVLRSRW